MAQKKKGVSSHRHGNLANRKAPNKKKSILNTKIISNGEEATQKFNKKKKKSIRPYQICKGKSIVEPSNDNTDQMQIDQVIRIYLQDEIMMDILTKLPVQSLLRFKCVSEFWNSLINDTYFRMKHYIHSKNDQNSQKFLITESFYDKDDVYNFSTSSLSMVQVVEDEQKLDCPSSCKPTNVILFCSCDGLVLIFVSSRGLYDSSARLYEELLLWNLSTRESILLPHPEFRVVYCVCGLGYDATSEDYKILAINLNADDSFNTSIEVLSLKSGSWRRIGYPTGIQRVSGFRNCVHIPTRKILADDCTLAEITIDKSTNNDYWLSASFGHTCGQIHGILSKELAESINGYNISNKIGEGGFGVVCYAELKGKLRLDFHHQYHNGLRYDEFSDTCLCMWIV
uniref:Class S F-box protein n=1 Tax=Solanum tuberosum TaxID=4113 RepID=M1CDU1_SOLTU